MVFNWKKIKEILIQRKGLVTLSLSDITGTGITSIFWLYIAFVIQPEQYGEIFYFISIAAIAFNLSICALSVFNFFKSPPLLTLEVAASNFFLIP